MLIIKAEATGKHQLEVRYDPLVASDSEELLEMEKFISSSCTK